MATKRTKRPKGRRGGGKLKAKPAGGRKAGAVAKGTARRRSKASPGKSGDAEMARRGAKTFPVLKGADGCGAMLEIVEHVGGKWEFVEQRGQVAVSAESGGRGGKAAKSGAGRRRMKVSPRTCRALAAFGHQQRVRLLSKLLEGPATYRALQRVTKLKAGPLYHHVNQLRLAGLILPKQRDLYELTRGGRNLILMAMIVGPPIGDGRRRPVGG